MASGDDELMGTAQIAELLDVSRQMVDKLSRTDDTFPKPIGKLAQARVWRRDDIEQWARRRSER